MASKTITIKIDGDASGFTASVSQSEDALAGLEGTGEGTSGMLGGLMEGLGGVGEAFLSAGTAVAAFAAAAYAALYEVGSQFSEAYDQIRVGTGATGDALGVLEDDFKNVVSTVPASFGDASSAITKLNQVLGLTGAPLDAMAEQLLNLSRITGTDINQDVEQSTRLFQNWNVATSEQSSVLDFLFRTTQMTGIGFNQLASEVTDNGVKLRELGFSLEDTAALFGGLSKAGIDASAVMPAFSKELANSMKSGKDAEQVLADFFNEVEHSPNKIKVGEDAIKLFGARAGPQLVEAIQEGKLQVADLENSIALGSDTINKAAGDTEHLGERLTELKNRLMVFVEPIAMTVFDQVDDASKKIGPAFDDASKGVGIFWAAFTGHSADLGPLDGAWATIERVGTAARSVADVIGGYASTAWTTLRGAIEPVVGWLQTTVPGAFDTVRAAVVQVATWLSPMIGYIQQNSEVFTRLAQAAGIVAAVLLGAVVVALAASAVVIAAVVAAAVALDIALTAGVAVLYNVAQTLWDVFNNVKTAIGTALTAVVGFFQELPGRVMGFLAGVWSTISGWVTGVAAQLPGLLAGWVTGFLSWIVNFAAQLPVRLAFIAGFIIGWIAGTAVSIVIGMAQWVAAFFNAIGTLASNIPGWLANVWNAFLGWLNFVANTLPADLQQWTLQFLTWVNNVAGQVPGWLGNVWSAINGWLSRSAANIASDLVQWAQAFWNWVNDVAGSIGNHLADITANVVSWARGIPGAITGALGDLAKIGASIVEGIIHGVQGLAGWAMDQLKSFAGGLVSGFMSAIKGGSPAMEFAPSGESIAQGVAYGIDSGAPQVHDAVGRLGASTVAAAGDTFVPGPLRTGPFQTPARGAVGAGNGEVHIHLHGVVLADEEAIGRAVNRALQAADRQGNRMAWEA